jgi:hypothetical protein
MPFNSFKQFTKLYEEDSSPADNTEGSFPPEADLLLKNIAQLGLSVLWYLNMMVPDYKDTIADIQSVVQAPDKLAKLVEIATKIKGSVKNQEYIQAGIPELFLQAAQENAKAFQKFTETYCQTEEGKESMKEFVEDQILGYLKFLEEESKKIAQKTQTAELAKESRFWFSLGSESLYEQDNDIKRKLLQGNKGFVKMLSKEATVIASDLELAKRANPAQESEIVALETKLNGILAELAKLSVAKRSDITQNKLDELADELNSIPKSLSEIQKKAAEKIQKGSQNWDISSIYLKALNFYQQALEKFNQIKPAPSESKPTSGIKSQAEGVESIVRIKPDDDNVKDKVNPDVQKFQEFVIAIFADSEIKDDPLFLKFQNYGADGKFGPTTKAMVKSLKAAFDMDSETPNISKELIQELIDYAKEKKLMESEIFFEPKVVDFRTFSASLFEGFDPEKFKSAARKFSGGRSGSGTGGGSQRGSQSGSGGSSTGGSSQRGSQSGSGGSSTGGSSQRGSGSSDTPQGGDDKGKNSTAEEMQIIYNLLRAAVRGPGTNKDKLLQAIELLKSKKDLITLDKYINKNYSYFSMPIGKDRLSLQDILRDELETTADDLDLANKIKKKLESFPSYTGSSDIGVTMNFDKKKHEKGFEFLFPDSIVISSGGASGSW